MPGMKDPKVFQWSLAALLGAAITLASAQDRVATAFSTPPGRVGCSTRWTKACIICPETALGTVRSGRWDREY